MESKMIEEIKELFQSFIAPQLAGIKGTLDSKLQGSMLSRRRSVALKQRSGPWM
jgi:hypothetical protein